MTARVAMDRVVLEQKGRLKLVEIAAKKDGGVIENDFAEKKGEMEVAKFSSLFPSACCFLRT